MGKQRLEAFQLLRVLREPEQRGWSRHPAALMWSGYEEALALYMNTIIREWKRRGYRNSIALAQVPNAPTMPWWLGDPTFHAAHRSNLLRKDSEFYGQYGWAEPPDLPYVWPFRQESQ